MENASVLQELENDSDRESKREKGGHTEGETLTFADQTFRSRGIALYSFTVGV